MANNREDLARVALERKSAIQTQLQGIDQQVDQLAQQQEKLIENDKKLAHKIESFRTKKETIKAQYSAAEAQVKITEAATGVGEEMADVGLAIQRAEQKTEDMTARAAAMDELEQAGALGDLTQLEPGSDIDRELAQLSSDSQVESELAALKAGMGSGEPAKLDQGEESQ